MCELIYISQAGATLTKRLVCPDVESMFLLLVSKAKESIKKNKKKEENRNKRVRKVKQVELIMIAAKWLGQ